MGDILEEFWSKPGIPGGDNVLVEGSDLGTPMFIDRIGVFGPELAETGCFRPFYGERKDLGFPKEVDNGFLSFDPQSVLPTRRSRVQSPSPALKNRGCVHERSPFSFVCSVAHSVRV
jgi:hypothetical protein